MELLRMDYRPGVESISDGGKHTVQIWDVVFHRKLFEDKNGYIIALSGDKKLLVRIVSVSGYMQPLPYELVVEAPKYDFLVN